MLATFTATLAIYVAGVLMPPAQYDRPYKGRLHVAYVSPERLAWECFSGQRGLRGCAMRFRPGHCSIYMANNGSKAERRALYRHERAHCNGWPKDHRG